MLSLSLSFLLCFTTSAPLSLPFSLLSFGSKGSRGRLKEDQGTQEKGRERGEEVVKQKRKERERESIEKGPSLLLWVPWSSFGLTLPFTSPSLVNPSSLLPPLSLPYLFLLPLTSFSPVKHPSSGPKKQLDLVPRAVKKRKRIPIFSLFQKSIQNSSIFNFKKNVT
jgi:hypothetical protein